MAQQPEKLSAAQRSKIRRLSQPKELAADEEGGELNIVPFLDIITNVMMFVLATVTVSFTATIETNPPKAGGSGPKPTTPSLGLTILVVSDGFSVKARGGNVAPGCGDTGTGLAVGMGVGADGKPDWNYKQLTECVAKLKGASSDFADETQVTLSANPNIPYQAIIGTIDAVRMLPAEKRQPGQDCTHDEKLGWTGPACLFPEVNFGLAR
jgi:biopolymer transport protein ExbD